MSSDTVDATWLEALGVGDLIQSRRALEFQRGGQGVRIDRNVSMLLIETTLEDDRIAFKLLHRGQVYDASMLRTAFCQAFMMVSQFSDAQS